MVNTKDKLETLHTINKLSREYQLLCGLYVTKKSASELKVGDNILKMEHAFDSFSDAVYNTQTVVGLGDNNIILENTYSTPSLYREVKHDSFGWEIVFMVSKNEANKALKTVADYGLKNQTVREKSSFELKPSPLGCNPAYFKCADGDFYAERMMVLIEAEAICLYCKDHGILAPIFAEGTFGLGFYILPHLVDECQF